MELGGNAPVIIFNYARIEEAAAKVIADVKQQNYSDYTAGVYGSCYNGLLKYIMEMGVDYYVTKPFDTTALLSKIKEFLGRKK